MANQQNEGFVRQRRNLMIVSLILLFSEATDLRVEKISAFGTELLVGQPQAVTMALWVAALYWLVRYYQYSRAEYHGALEQFIQSRVSQRTCPPVALKRLLREEPSLLEKFHDIKALPSIDYKSFSIKDIKHNYLVVTFELTKTATDGQATVTQGIGERTVRLDGADLFWLRFQSWIHLILHTTLFTELVLPYIVFALPVLYVGYKFIR